MQKLFIIVERQAEQINMLKDGMWIEAKHVKRKDLHTYVSASLLKRERKVWKYIFLCFVYIVLSHIAHQCAVKLYY